MRDSQGNILQWQFLKQMFYKVISGLSDPRVYSSFQYRPFAYRLKYVHKP